jgi:hypothetical protein
MHQMPRLAEGIDYKIDVKMAGKTRITTITALDSRTNEKIGEITFEKSKKAFGKRTKGMDKTLNSFITDTTCRKCLNTAKNADLPLEERKAAMKQLGALYSSPSISPEIKQEIRAFMQNIHREVNLVAVSARLCANPDDLRELIPEGKFPSITMDHNPGYICGREKIHTEHDDVISYYEAPEHDNCDVLRLDGGFIEANGLLDFESNVKAHIEPRLNKIKKTLKDPESLDSQTCQGLREELDSMLSQLDKIQTSLDAHCPKLRDLLEIMNAFPDTQQTSLFDRECDQSVGAKAGAATRGYPDECKKLKTKIEGIIAELQKYES